MQIEINGKKVGVKFNNYAVERFNDLLNITDTASGEQYAYVYAGIEGWRCVTEFAPGSTFVAPVVSFEEIVEWVDSASENDEVFETVKQIRQLFVEHPVMKKAIAIVEAQQQKKSLITEVTTSD